MLETSYLKLLYTIQVINLFVKTNVKKNNVKKSGESRKELYAYGKTCAGQVSAKKEEI